MQHSNCTLQAVYLVISTIRITSDLIYKPITSTSSRDLSIWTLVAILSVLMGCHRLILGESSLPGCRFLPLTSQMSISAYTPTGVEAVLGGEKKNYTRAKWGAARRAIIRQGVHKDQTDNGDVLHSMYTDLHGWNGDLNAKKALVGDTMSDICDTVCKFSFRCLNIQLPFGLLRWIRLMAVYPFYFDAPTMEYPKLVITWRPSKLSSRQR